MAHARVGDDAYYVDYIRRTTILEDDELPADEFAEEFQNKAFGRARSNTRKDVYSFLSGIKSLYHHLTFTEFIIITLASLGVTLFFCYYLYPGPADDYHLSARLRFNIIVTAVLFPSTMLVAETIGRRDVAMRRFAVIKGEMCQILEALLTWRTPHIIMSDAWEEQVHQVMSQMVIRVHQLLLQPTIRDRHQYTKEGRAFAAAILQRRRELKDDLMRLNFKIHCFVEDLKEAGLSPMESIRLFQYIQIFSQGLEVVYSIKHYRTNQSSRAFSRIILTSCIMFYG
jgi:hypothetical protein